MVRARTPPGNDTAPTFLPRGREVDGVRGGQIRSTRREVGTVNEIVTYTRDAAGNPLVEEHRLVAGSLGDDYGVTRSYDAAGRQLSERHYHLNGVLSGAERWCAVWTYDDCGNLLSLDNWDACDQPVARSTTYSYECFAR